MARSQTSFIHHWLTMCLDTAIRRSLKPQFRGRLPVVLSTRQLRRFPKVIQTESGPI